MKKHLFIATLAAACLLTLQTSCEGLSRRVAQAALEEANIETGHTPRYLRDSEEWGKVVKQEFELDEFEQIRTAGLVDILFTQGDEFSVTVEGNEKVLPLYNCSVEEGTLVVHTTKENAHNIPFVRFYVTAPTLTKIDLTGAGDVMFRQPVEFFNDLEIHISGAGDIEIDSLLCDAFNAEINGAGDIEMRRLQCLSSNIKMTGAGETAIKRISCREDAAFTIMGSGDAEVKVKCRNLRVDVDGDGEAKIECECESVTAVAAGTGRIDLEGTASNVDTQHSGLATISTRQLRNAQ